MKIAPINYYNNKATKKGRTIGTIAGAGAGAAVVIKDHKDVYNRLSALGAEKLKQAADEVSLAKLKETLPKNAKRGTIAACAAIVAGALVIGRIAGGIIGKIIDNHKAKKLN